MARSVGALVVVDMQNDFCNASSPLCVLGAAQCQPKVREAVALARECRVPVFWVTREHDPSGIDIEWTRVHLITGNKGGATLSGTKGAELVEGLEKREGDYSIIKRRFSAFFATPLDLMLRRLGVTDVVLCGIQTPNCIRGTATDAIALDYKVQVLADATASKSDEVQAANLSDMRDMGIKTPLVSLWAETLHMSNT